MDSLSIGLTAAFAAGVLSFLSPCVLPLVPSYLSFITGLGMEELESGGAELRRTTLVHSLLFVGGFSFIFMALGASATLLGQVMREYQVWIARIGGVIVILFGLRCLDCGRVADIEQAGRPEWLRSLSAGTDFDVVGYRLELVATCPECRA